MRYAYFGFGMLLFGSIGLVLIVMMQAVTINNDSEYYNLKEAMQAAMLESIDYVCYRVDGKTVSSTSTNQCGYLLKISEQKFVENFTRRFVSTVGGDAVNYTIDFYDIMESPPKASVVIKSKTNNYGIVSGNEGLTITNSLSGILELKKSIKGMELLDSSQYTIINEIKREDFTVNFATVASGTVTVDDSAGEIADASCGKDCDGSDNLLTEEIEDDGEEDDDISDTDDSEIDDSASDSTSTD